MSANVEVIRGAYRAFAEGDVPAVLAAMAPDIEWNEAENFPYADGNPYIGPEAVAEGVFARIGKEWDSWSITLEDVFDAGDNVVGLGRYRSRHSATGAELDAQFAHVWWLEDGKITRFQQYADTAQTLRAMGRI
ncbi:MAG: nuclear transport factor 2 family protein [Gemmatimonadota bacterium]